MQGRIIKQLPNWATAVIGAVVLIVVGYFVVSALRGGDDESEQTDYSSLLTGEVSVDANGDFTNGTHVVKNGKIYKTAALAPAAPTVQNQTGVTKDDIAAAVAAALAEQAKPQGSSVSVGNGTGNVISALQSRSGSAVTLDTFITMFSASEDLGMNAPRFNFDSEATKVIVLQAGEFDALVNILINKDYSQDDQVSGLKAALKAKFPGNTVPAIGFDMQTDGSSKAYGVEIKIDGTYTCKEYDGDVKQCTDDSGEADALDTFN